MPGRLHPRARHPWLACRPEGDPPPPIRRRRAMRLLDRRWKEYIFISSFVPRVKTVPQRSGPICGRRGQPGTTSCQPLAEGDAAGVPQRGCQLGFVVLPSHGRERALTAGGCTCQAPATRTDRGPKARAAYAASGAAPGGDPPERWDGRSRCIACLPGSCRSRPLRARPGVAD